MRRRPLLSFALAAVFAVLGASCLSPTLPLPPPDVESVQMSSPTQWTIAGSCQPGAIVSIFNDTQKQGVLYQDVALMGRYVVTLTADQCDMGWVSEVVGTEASGQTAFLVEPRTQNDTGTSSICH